MNKHLCNILCDKVGSTQTLLLQVKYDGYPEEETSDFFFFFEL